MIDDEELDDGYEPAQFKIEQTFESDVTSTFNESLQWRTEDVYFIEIKHRISGKLKESGGPYSFLTMNRIMEDLKEKNKANQWLIKVKKEVR